MKDHKLKVGHAYFKEKEVPLIRLSGDWLKQLGFGLGQRVVVREGPGQLVIQLVEEGKECE